MKYEKLESARAAVPCSSFTPVPKLLNNIFLWNVCTATAMVICSHPACLITSVWKQGEDESRKAQKRVLSVFSMGGRSTLWKAALTEWYCLTLPFPILFVPCLWQKETHRLLPLTWAQSPLRCFLGYTIKHLPRNFLQKHCYPIYSQNH